ncbi:MAG TPA: DUF2085 domain-containing protein [Thermoplasmata archaeon]
MRIPKITSPVLFAVFVATLAWLLLVLLSSYLVSPDTLSDLTGSVGVVDNKEQFAPLGPVPKAVYSIGDWECHQIADRSYFLNGNQMPFCARDLGLFAGIAAGFALTAFVLFTPNPLLLLLGLVPMGIDGGLQAVTDYESTNPLRLVTGLIAGIALSLIIAQFVFAFKQDREKATQGLDEKRRP